MLYDRIHAYVPLVRGTIQARVESKRYYREYDLHSTHSRVMNIQDFSGMNLV